MKLLVVGLGSIGRRHLRNLRALLPEAHITLCRLRGQAAPADPEAEALADRIVLGLSAALELNHQAAILAGPAPTHLAAALPLARRGVHLLVEKPLSHDLVGVDELIGECRQRELALMVGYTLRFLPALGALKEAVASGAIGRLLYLRAEMGQYLPTWRPGADYRQGVSARRELGGGVMLELSHEVDLALWLGGAVNAVYARAERVGELDVDVEDLAEMVLRLEGGAVASLHLDMLRQPARRACQLVGSAGTLEWSAQEGGLRLYDGATGAWRDLIAPQPPERNQMYLDELAHFLDCVQTGRPPAVSGEDGKRVLQVIEAARLAAAQGKEVKL